MNCKICLSEIAKKEKHDLYHDECFRLVFGTIKIDSTLPFNRSEFKTDRARRHNKQISISGVQPKLLISIQEESLEVTDVGGTHILKVSPEEYPFAAENEHLTMEIMRFLKVDTALCGLMSLKGGEQAYITKRFDRNGNSKIHQEDMMQAMGIPSEGNSKYESRSYEDVGLFLGEQAKNLIIVSDFFKRVVLNFLLGNDDYHLKNISIRPNEISQRGNCLTPLYDSLNTEIYDIGKERVGGELALDLVREEEETESFRKYGYHTMLCFDELAVKIGLNTKFTKNFYEYYRKNFDEVLKMVESSYLTAELKMKYKKSLQDRMKKLFAPEGPYVTK